MKYHFILFILFGLSVIDSFGQLTKSELIGNWTTDDIDSSYNLESQVTFYQDVNHWHILDFTVCKTVDMEVQENSFRLKESFRCTEPGRESWRENQSIKLQGLPFRKKLIISTGVDTITFRVISYRTKKVDRYPWEVKELKIRKIK